MSFKNLEKNKVLGIRISEETHEEFERYCNRFNVSKSEIGRKAIIQYIILNFNPDLNPKLVFAKNQFKYCISCMNKEQIEELANISIKNGTIDTQILKSIISESEFEDEDYAGFDFQMKTLVRFVFSQDAENWFDDISFWWDKEELMLNLKGTHQLGTHFTEYIVRLLKKYANLYNFEIYSQKRYMEKNPERETNSIEITFREKKSKKIKG